jgi:predicted aspartyl protease
MILDTGAGCTVLDAAKDWTFHFKPLDGVTHSLNGRKHPFALVNSLGIGPAEVRNLRVGLVRNEDLEGPYSRSLGGVDGFVGLDVLRAGRAVVDCQRAFLFWKVVPNAPNVMAATLPKSGWTAVKMNFNGGNYYVPGRVAGQNLRFMVDTGASATTVDRGFAKRNGLKTNGQQVSSVGIHHHDRDGYVTTPPELTIGDFRVQSFPIAANYLGGLLDSSTAVLGGDFLGRNLAMIDCETNTLYLKNPHAP